MGDWGGKPDKGSIDEKPPELDEEMWEENQKIIDIVVEKTFQDKWIWQSFADLLSGAQTVLCRALGRTRTVPNVYVCTYVRSNHLA